MVTISVRYYNIHIVYNAYMYIMLLVYYTETGNHQTTVILMIIVGDYYQVESPGFFLQACTTLITH